MFVSGCCLVSVEKLYGLQAEGVGLVWPLGGLC